MIETSQLQTLVAVAQTGSFSRAAEELCVTQSAISQSVKNLERKLGVRIFKRSGKKVILTLEGNKLFSMGKQFLVHLENTIKEVKNDREKMSGGIRIGAVTGIAKSWLFPIITKFAHEYPDISLNFKMGNPDELLDRFESFALDFVIVPEQDSILSGQVIPFGEEYINLIFPKNGRFPITKETDFETLNKYPVIIFENRDSLFRSWCHQRYGIIPKSINTRFAVNSHGNMLTAVSEGLGIAVLPTHVLKRTAFGEEIQTLDDDCEVFYKRFNLVCHKESKDLVRVNVLIDRILAFIRERNFRK